VGPFWGPPLRWLAPFGCPPPVLTDSLEASLYKTLFNFKAILWGVNHPFVAAFKCKAYPIAILLHGHCAV